MIEKFDNSSKNLKLYNSKHVGIATFIGGPLAAGYLMYENFKALQKPDLARNSIIFGILCTIVLFVIIFSIPENILDKIPNVIFPAIYTAIIYFLIQKYQGASIEEHKNNNNPFFSIWRSVGIGLISLTLIVSGIFGYFYLIDDNEAYVKYDEEMKVFYDNEQQALQFYENIDSKSDTELLNQVNNTMTPKWEQNINITEKISTTEDLPLDLVEQNNTLLEYSKLRLKLSFLIKKSIVEQSDKRNEIGEIDRQIDSVLNTLK